MHNEVIRLNMVKTPNTSATVLLLNLHSRAYLEVFSKYKDSEDRVPLKNLRKACNDLDLYPSMSQGIQIFHKMTNPCRIIEVIEDFLM